MPSLVVGTVSHSRRVPIRHAFTHRAYQWLVDIDDLPQLPWWLRPLASFDALDHLDCGVHGGIRGDLAHFLASRGVRLEAADRVLMLANARVLGYVFDPLSVFWVIGADGERRAVVFEVHNTYGGRHSYLLEVEAGGRAATDKAFYVSPFNDVSGRYTITLRADDDEVRVTIALDRDGERVMVATTTGTPVPASPPTVLKVALRHLLMPQRVTVLIRFHGIRLWLRRLPIMPRPHQLKETPS